MFLFFIFVSSISGLDGHLNFKFFISARKQHLDLLLTSMDGNNKLSTHVNNTERVL